MSRDIAITSRHERTAHNAVLGGTEDLDVLLGADHVAKTLLLFDEQLLVHAYQSVAALECDADLLRITFRKRDAGGRALRQRRRHVKRRVRSDNILGRAVFRVQVDRERLARQVLAVFRQDDALETVPRVLVGLEDQRAIEQRQERLHLVRFGVPRIGVQLDRAAPGVMPFLVQVHEEVDAPVQHPPLVDVEVDVRVEPLPVEVLVRSAAEQRLVGDEVGNPGERPRSRTGTGPS